MFETLVSSKIRRSLLEHILAQPDHRFYLRGLAKELVLPVSPLRRELMRLEQLGVLKAYQEANIRFYVVDQTSPQFAQLKQASLLTPAPQEAPAEPLVASIVVSHQKTERIRRALTPAITWPLVIGTTSVGVLVIAAVGLGVYLAATNQRPLPLSVSRQAVVTPPARIAVVEAQPRPSGEMRSARWRLLPGAVGGFSSGSSTEETY